MTQPLTIMGFFCEDIRQESDNIITLVGLLPDSINVALQESLAAGKEASFGSNRILGKLCFYARANFDPKLELKNLPFFLALPDGQRVPAGEVAGETIEKSKAQAVQQSLPFAGVTIRAILGGFRFPKEGGLIRLEADVNGEPYLVAILNAQTIAKVISSNASSQPS